MNGLHFCDACGSYHITHYRDCVLHLPTPVLAERLKRMQDQINTLQARLDEHARNVYLAQAEGYGAGYRDGFADGRG